MNIIQTKFINIIKSSIITILLMVIWTFVIYTTNFQNQLTTLIQYLFFALGIYLSHYFYKKEYNYMPYSEGLKLGLGVSSIVGLFYSLLIFFSIKLDEKKTILKTMKSSIAEALKNKGIDDITIQSFLNKIDNLITPFKSALFILIFMLIVGLIFSLIISVFSKKNHNNE